MKAPSDDPVRIVALRRRLLEVGYTEEGIEHATNIGTARDPWSLATGEPPGDGSPFSTIVTLFQSGAPVEADRLSAAIEPLRLSDLEQLNLIELRGSHAHPLCLIHRAEGLLVASDVPALHTDRVLGVVPASETLARLTVRRQAGRALDLGTGCGVQGLLLARHTTNVVSVDVNPRALAFARFNAALNDITAVRCVEGSWFAPVDDERFDIIACNPPYVISPDAAYTYRDGGLPRDAVSRMVIREAASHLASGGFATILCNWVQDESWTDPLRTWVADTGCDAVLLHYATVTPASYAARWNIELRPRPPVFKATVQRWLDYYRREGISRIGLGGVILRRREAATNWIRALDMATGPGRTSGDHVMRLFTAADFLETVKGRDLFNYAFTLVDGHRVDQTLAYPSDKYVIGPAVYRHIAGIGLEARIDPRVLEVLLECNGRGTLEALVNETAARRGEPADAVAALVEEPVRQLVERGFIIPIVDGPTGE
jgi:methylase of polypeptide subunit release factors